MQAAPAASPSFQLKQHARVLRGTAPSACSLLEPNVAGFPTASRSQSCEMSGFKVNIPARRHTDYTDLHGARESRLAIVQERLLR